VGNFPERDIATGMKLTGTEVERLSLEVRGPVARITLRNPPLNIIDIPMMEELALALAEIEAQPDISIVVFRGEGNCFSAGVDVAAHTPDKVVSMLEKFLRVIRSFIATK
jgi:enoyl-CoA hydratase/carnithine racemase